MTVKAELAFLFVFACLALQQLREGGAQPPAAAVAGGGDLPPPLPRDEDGHGPVSGARGISCRKRGAALLFSPTF